MFTGNAPDRSRRCVHTFSSQLVKPLVEQVSGFRLFPTACASCFSVFPHTHASFCHLILRRSMPFTVMEGNSTDHNGVISVTGLPTREVTFDTGGKPAHCEPLRRTTPRGHKTPVLKYVSQILIMLCDLDIYQA